MSPAAVARPEDTSGDHGLRAIMSFVYGRSSAVGGFTFIAAIAACGGETLPPPLKDGGRDAAVDAVDSASASDAAPHDASPISCSTDAPGAGKNCGTSGADDCCASLSVSGGSFLRNYDGVNLFEKAEPATTSPFYLDKYEVTVGRFRAFVEAYPGSRPKQGDGAHPKHPESGWNPSWFLPNTQAALRQQLATDSGCKVLTWTDQSGPNEKLPINCVPWYDVFAFCAWDRGRLPTSAEWEFAAGAGSEQRVFPWSQPPTSATVDATFAAYEPTPAYLSGPLPVGSFPKGASAFGQFDLAGNVEEVMLDGEVLPGNCDDCVEPATNGRHDMRGGSWDGPYSNMYIVIENVTRESDRFRYQGARCARDP